MKGKKWFILLVSLAVVLLASSIGVTHSSFVDPESSTGNAFQAWASTLWVQTTQGDFEAGVLNSVDTSSSPGDVKLAASSDTVTDTFVDETKIASKTNLVVTGGQVKLTTTDATETLRPNADGDLTEFEDLIGAPTHWEAVDEEVADDAATHVGSDVAGRTDLFQLTDSGLATGTKINSITVYERVRREGGNDDDWQIVIKSGTTSAYSPTFNNETNTWVERSYQWTTDPNTGEAWTVAAVNALQAGAYVVTGVDVTQVYVVVDYTVYDSPGTLISTNLLSGETVSSIDSFGYNASAIPSGTGLKVQFSQDSTNWYNSAGTASGWDTLSPGTHTIDLSGLGWSGANFYYKMEFTSDGTDTPVLDEISITYSPGYYTSGTIASQVLDTGVTGARWDALFWDETLQTNTDITFEVRASDTQFLKDAATPSWTSVGGTSPLTSGLPSGRYMQWRATLTTSDPSKTPTLHEVRVYYY